MTKILHKFVNAEAGLESEVGFYAAAAKPFSVILRDLDSGEAVPYAERFADEAAAVEVREIDHCRRPVAGRNLRNHLTEKMNDSEAKKMNRYEGYIYEGAEHWYFYAKVEAESVSAARAALQKVRQRLPSGRRSPG